MCILWPGCGAECRACCFRLRAFGFMRFRVWDLGFRVDAAVEGLGPGA